MRKPFGIALDDLLVIEADPTLAFPNARGDTFVALPKTSPLTMGLVPTDEARDVTGVIGLHYAGGTVKFRKVQIRRL